MNLEANGVAKRRCTIVDGMPGSRQTNGSGLRWQLRFITATFPLERRAMALRKRPQRGRGQRPACYERRAIDRYSTCTGLRGAMVRAGIAGR